MAHIYDILFVAGEKIHAFPSGNTAKVNATDLTEI